VLAGCPFSQRALHSAMGGMECWRGKKKKKKRCDTLQSCGARRAIAMVAAPGVRLG
jgi:hypothetical protein